jgi:Pyruvate/2-oxoacid:ferredoxin oxidoreductase gamma subunit
VRKFAQEVPAGGLIFYNRDSPPADMPPTQARVICVPASELADQVGSAKAANVVMLGALLEETEYLAPATALRVLEDKIKKISLLEIDRLALAAGRRFIDQHAHDEAVTQADGFAY